MSFCRAVARLSNGTFRTTPPANGTSRSGGKEKNKNAFLCFGNPLPRFEALSLYWAQVCFEVNFRNSPSTNPRAGQPLSLMPMRPLQG